MNIRDCIVDLQDNSKLFCEELSEELGFEISFNHIFDLRFNRAKTNFKIDCYFEKDDLFYSLDLLFFYNRFRFDDDNFREIKRDIEKMLSSENPENESYDSIKIKAIED